MYVIVKGGVGYWDGGMFRPSRGRARLYATADEAQACVDERRLGDDAEVISA